jgi:hypothetical protein
MRALLSLGRRGMTSRLMFGFSVFMMYTSDFRMGMPCG